MPSLSKMSFDQCEDLVVFNDRMPVRSLKSEYKDVYNALRQRGAGKVETKERIHFCGLVIDAQRKPFIFAPIKYCLKDPSKAASVVMEVLKKYGRESRRPGEISVDGPATAGLISTVADIVDDFILYGVYREGTRIATRGTGKPDWVRTILRTSPLISGSGTPVYPDFFGSKRADHSGAIISRIQVAILQEILDIFGWWRKDLVSYRETLRRLPLPVEKRDHWVRLLARAKRDLYQDRAIRLVDKLADYIENTKNIGSGTTLYGVDDFHTIWEHMLRATLYGVDDGWNSRLPKPILIRKNSDDTLLTRNGMKTDIVLRSDKSLFVLDAKYYLADSESELPGWADISKQLLYEMMLKDTAGSEVNVKNAFVFPAAQDFLSDFDSIEVRTRNFRLPTIKFIYLAIEDVMIRYIENKKVSIIGKLLD